MMVTFVSQCQKNALKKTRRVLDAFANRIGDYTWQTVITAEGLAAVKKLLRKNASKNTAVSCHWLRSRSRSELVWIVGKRDGFNAQGLVATNTTRTLGLNHRHENDWQYLPLIQSLTAVAALFHDWGKATALFQEKLSPSSGHKFKGDPIRHEWISCLLLSAFIKQGKELNDPGWLNRLSQGLVDENTLAKTLGDINSQVTTNPFTGLPELAKLVAWLIVSHHRLPNLKKDKIQKYKQDKPDSIDSLLNKISKEWGYENRHDEAEYQTRLKSCFNFPKGFLSQSKPWNNELKRWSAKLLGQQALASQSLEDGSYRIVLHHARLCLMLGDHYYSSCEANKQWQNSTGLFANTDRKTKQLKQKLDEHLVGVAKQSIKNAYLLPAFETKPPQARDINSLKKLSPAQFRWQDKAVDKIKQWRASNKQDRYGVFAVNMASTGCGKTFANAKVMRALSDDGDNLRFTLALGLRTLTLQTGDEYRQRIGLDDSELAVLIGSRAVLELHQAKQQESQTSTAEGSGSESLESLLDEDIDFDCNIPEEGLATVLRCERDRRFLYAPVLSCTIDHMMAATETTRGGRYILPSLRMMSSDLVIDEIDDFSGDDLIAIGRLIFFAAMMGRKVMISSATIPPDLAEGYFKAYRDGWRLYAQSRNVEPLIACAWIDEFATQVASNHHNGIAQAIPQYRTEHAAFIEKRLKKLTQQDAKHRADIIQCQFLITADKQQASNSEADTQTKQQGYFAAIAQAALNKHSSHHCQEASSQLNISFGVIRVANIPPCVALSQYLIEQHRWPANTQVRVMAYHSQQVLLLRSEQEKHLDQVLERKESRGEAPAAFSHPVIQQHIKSVAHNKTVKNLLFILVATPVEEVGRDHDFDWAIIEPSSFRSIIQLAGRIRRHRKGAVKSANIGLMQYNWKGIKNAHLKNEAVFKQPGVEDFIRLSSHNLADLVDCEQISQRLDATPRIQKGLTQNYGQLVHLKTTKQPLNSLAELEHFVTWAKLTDYQEYGPGTLQGYLNHSWFLTALPQTLVRFRDSAANIKLFLTYLPEQETYKFCEKDDDGWPIDRQAPRGIEQQALSPEATAKLWLVRDYAQLAAKLAEQQEQSLRNITLRYGEISLRDEERASYQYNDQLGLVKQ